MKVANDLGLLRNQCYLPNIHDKYSQQYHRDNKCHSHPEKPSPLSFAHTQSLPVILLTQSRSKASHSLTRFPSVYEHSTQPRQSAWSRRCSQDPPAKARSSPINLPASIFLRPSHDTRVQIYTLPSLPISSRSREVCLSWISALEGSLMSEGIEGLALAPSFTCWWLDTQS